MWNGRGGSNLYTIKGVVTGAGAHAQKVQFKRGIAPSDGSDEKMAKDDTNRGDRRVCAGSKREALADRIINGKVDITQSGACGNLIRNSAGWGK